MFEPFRPMTIATHNTPVTRYVVYTVQKWAKTTGVIANATAMSQSNDSLAKDKYKIQKEESCEEALLQNGITQGQNEDHTAFTKQEYVLVKSDESQPSNMLLTKRLPKVNDQKQCSVERHIVQTEITKTEDGRAWAILIVVTLFNILSGINWIAFSVYYTDITEYFQTRKAVTGWIGSTQIGFNNIFAIIVSPMVTMYGCRPVAMTGAVVVTVSVAVSSQATQVWMVFLAYGIGSGIGCSMTYLTCSVIIQQHFNKNRALASGIAMSGLTIGNMLGPVIVDALMHAYGWRGAMLLQAGIVAHNIALGCLFLPPTSHTKIISPTKHKQSSEEDSSVTKRFSHIFKQMFDFTLLRDIPFALFCISVGLLFFNSTSFWQHCISRSIHLGLSRQESSTLVSILSFAILISRIVNSFIGNCKCTDRIAMFTVGILLGGLSSFALTFAQTYVSIAAVSVLFGIHLGISVTISTVCLVDLLGVDKITRSQSVLNFFYGTAAIICTPLSGLLFDLTQDYDLPFRVTGTMAFIGGFTALTTCILQRRRRPVEIEIIETDIDITTKA